MGWTTITVKCWRWSSVKQDAFVVVDRLDKSRHHSSHISRFDDFLRSDGSKKDVLNVITDRKTSVNQFVYWDFDRPLNTGTGALQPSDELTSYRPSNPVLWEVIKRSGEGRPTLFPILSRAHKHYYPKCRQKLWSSIADLNLQARKRSGQDSPS